MLDAIQTGVGEQLEYTSNIVSESLKDAIPLGRTLAQAQEVAAKNEKLAVQLELCIGGAQDLITKLPLATQNGAGHVLTSICPASLPPTPPITIGHCRFTLLNHISLTAAPSTSSACRRKCRARCSWLHLNTCSDVLSRCLSASLI